jgi:hypothetical protein
VCAASRACCCSVADQQQRCAAAGRAHPHQPKPHNTCALASFSALELLRDESARFGHSHRAAMVRWTAALVAMQPVNESSLMSSNGVAAVLSGVVAHDSAPVNSVHSSESVDGNRRQFEVFMQRLASQSRSAGDVEPLFQPLVLIVFGLIGVIVLLLCAFGMYNWFDTLYVSRNVERAIALLTISSCAPRCPRAEPAEMPGNASESSTRRHATTRSRGKSRRSPTSLATRCDRSSKVRCTNRAALSRRSGVWRSDAAPFSPRAPACVLRSRS